MAWRRQISVSAGQIGNTDLPERDRCPLIQAAFLQVNLIQAEIVSEFVQIGRANFLAVILLVAFHEFPDVFQIEDDLRWQRRISGLRQRRPYKQSEQIRIVVLPVSAASGLA